MSQSKGIGGILDQIVGINDRQPRRDSKPRPPVSPASQTEHELGRAEATDPEKRMGARRGRPLGNLSASGSREPKAKVTVWIAQTLIDQYRDWSWEVRQPLSTLVQQAMQEYRNRSRVPSTS
jgi:hypothetical protein